MSMMRFGELFREVAEKETRMVTVPAALIDRGKVILPADEYGLDEHW